MKYTSLTLLLALILVSCDSTDPSSLSGQSVAPLAESGADVLAAKTTCPAECFGGDAAAFISTYAANNANCVGNVDVQINRLQDTFFATLLCPTRGTNVLTWYGEGQTVCATTLTQIWHNLDNKREANDCLTVLREGLRNVE